MTEQPKTRSERLAEVPHARRAWTVLAIAAIVLLGGGVWMFINGTRVGNGGAQGFAVMVLLWGLIAGGLAVGGRSVMRKNKSTP